MFSQSSLDLGSVIKLTASKLLLLWVLGAHMLTLVGLGTMEALFKLICTGGYFVTLSTLLFIVI